MKFPDVIGIGAINYDYMFNCKATDTRSSGTDSGREDLGRPEDEVREEIEELRQSGNMPETQIGGSALLALKAINAIDESLSISYVGVCGQLTDYDKRYGSISSVKRELSFIDNQEWLFCTNDTFPEDVRFIGKSVVRLHKHIRDNIKISEGANGLLIDLIKQKEQREGVSFADFLSQAKWIHVSSLGTFERFSEIMGYVMRAKEKNRFLRISIDPGFQFTQYNREALQIYLKASDYVFLSRKEYLNLIINEDLPENEKYIKLATYFNDPENANTKVFIVKHKNRHELIDFVNGIPYVYYHSVIGYFQIYNDTGAGDCFAGGFISGVLSDRLVAYQPAAVELGVLAAKDRMTAPDSAEVYENIKNASKSFFEQAYKNGRDSKRKKIVFFLKSHYKPVLAFIGGAIASYVIETILSIFF